MAAHVEACHVVGIFFIPQAAETLGALSSEAIDTIASIGHIQGKRLGIPPSESIRHLFQRLAIALCSEGHCSRSVCLSIYLRLFSHYRLRGGLCAIPTASVLQGQEN